MEKFFKLKENNTNVKTEFNAGLITFCAMAYILVVNANMYTNPFGNGENILNLSYNAIYIATALSATVGCLLMGLIAKLPVGLASGMGLNAFFIYTACISLGFTYENALVMILTEGLIFLILSLTGQLQKIYKAIPENICCAISVGIGLFIALLGLQSAGITVIDNATGIALNSFNILKIPFIKILPPVVALICLFVITVMAKKNVKGFILWGVFIGVVIYYLSGLFIPDFYNNVTISSISPLESYKEFFRDILAGVFVCGFDFSEYITKHGILNCAISFITTSISFCMVNMFDNIGSLHAACERGGLLKNGEIPNLDKAMLANSLAATSGAVMGVSTVTTYVESATGVIEGGRTGLTTIFIALFFLVATFLSPIAQLIPSCATAAALIYVGVLMMSSVKNIEWNNIECAVPSFLTICMMPYTSNISNGIAFGLISYVIIFALIGKIKEIKPIIFVIVALFLIMILFAH